MINVKTVYIYLFTLVGCATNNEKIEIVDVNKQIDKLAINNSEPVKDIKPYSNIELINEIKVLIYKSPVKLNISVLDPTINNKNYLGDYNISCKKQNTDATCLMKNILTNSTLIISEKTISIKSDGFIKVNSKTLREKISITISKNKLLVINHLPIKNYTIAVAASEMPISAHNEAIKAQLVAARNYAISVAKENKNNPYHLLPDQYDQVFRGANYENPKLAKLYKEIKNNFLVYNNQILKTFYCSSTGASIITPEKAWGNKTKHNGAYDNLISHWDKNDQGNNWQIKLSTKIGHMFNLNRLKEIKIMNQEFLEVKSIKVTDINNTSKIYSISKFKQTIKPFKLPSHEFHVTKTQKGFSLKGRGWGHSVGLSQRGAMAMANDNLKYQEILKFYYPNSQLISIN